MSGRWLRYVSAVVLATGCSRESKEPEPKIPHNVGRDAIAQHEPAVASTGTENKAMANLTNELTRLGYDRLFLSDDKDLERVWGAAGAPDLVRALVTDAATPPEARFLAAEVLARRDAAGFPPSAGVDVVAAAYAHALRHTVEANRWGMPGELDEPAGQHLVALGKAAVPALVPLLSDVTPMMYGGSKEAMVGNDYAYRVKDLAAFFVAKILALPYQVHESPAARDREIAQLAAKLPS